MKEKEKEKEVLKESEELAKEIQDESFKVGEDEEAGFFDFNVNG